MKTGGSATTADVMRSTRPVTRPIGPYTSPLLDMSAKEAALMSSLNVIGGFAFLSGPAAGIEQAVANADVIVPAAATVSAIGVLGVVGGIVGARRAYSQVSAEQERIIRLNKEFFLLFNIAADRYKKWEEAKAKCSGPASASPSKYEAKGSLSSAVLEAKRLEDEFYNIVTDIQMAATTATGRFRSVRMLEQNDSKDLMRRTYSTEVYTMGAVIAEYEKHRSSKAGKEEAQLWKTLKENKVYRKDNKLQDFFLDYSSASQVKEFFHGQNRDDKKAHDENVKKLEAALSKAERQQVSLLHDAVYLKNKKGLINSLKQLACVAEQYGRKLEDNDPGGGTLDRKKMAFYYAPLNKLYEDLLQKISEDCPESKQAVRDSWRALLPLIQKVEDNFNLMKSGVKDVPGQTSRLFGANGTFRQFWRQLPSKTCQHPDSGEVIPLNFEQNIYRGGKAPDRTNYAFLGIGVAGGLYATGKGLYVAAITLGAVSIGTMGFGLIVGAAVFALTLLSLYCYKKVKKLQSDRSVLAQNLRDARIRAFSTIRNDLAKAATTTSANKGMFPPAPAGSGGGGSAATSASGVVVPGLSSASLSLTGGGRAAAPIVSAASAAAAATMMRPR
jgi:hypothetical protein